MGEKRGMQALEAWCRQVTSGYNGVKVTNMTTSWKNGLAFCALIHHFRPDLIDFASLSAENIYHNNQLAFSVAENFLGIPALLDAEDMVNYVPDRLSIMTYVSQFYQVLVAPKNKGGSQMSVGLKRPGDRTAVGSSAPGCDSLAASSSAKTGSVTAVKVFSQQWENDSMPSRWQQHARRISDLCVSCKNSVFLAERLMVNGRLHHRVCFRCARCRSQLSLANYYETEQEQYCCETCPDEVVASSISTIPLEDSTSDRVTKVSSRSSAITITAEPISSDQYVPVQQQFDRPSDRQHRHFLDSMVFANDNPAHENNEDVKKDYTQAAFFVNVDENRTDVLETEDLMVGVGVAVVTGMPASVDHNDVTPDYNQVRQHVPEDSVIDEKRVAHEKCLTIVSETKDLAPIPESLKPVSKSGEVVEDPLTESVEILNEEKENNENVSFDALTAVVLLVKENKVDKQFEQTSVEEESNTFASPVIQVTADADDSTETVVPELRRRQKNKRSLTQQQKIIEKYTDEYPEELNPFEDKPQTEGAPVNESSQLDQNTSFWFGATGDTLKKTVPTPKISLNPFGSDDEDEEKNNSNDFDKANEKIRPGRPPPPVLKPPPRSTLVIVNPSPSPKKRPAPAPPPPKPQRTPNLASGRETSSISRRKSAPPPPNPEHVTTKSSVLTPTTISDITKFASSPKLDHNSTTYPSESLFQNDNDASDKTQKDLSNLHLQCNVNKDSHGQWKRKKGPAPPRPSPQKRQLRKLSLQGIQEELDDIEIKQLELERQGVNLEKVIRRLTAPEDEYEPVGAGVYIEEIILQLFDSVNEKNELLRRQTELMYIRRQQRLEEEHAELEFQIRCLIEKPKSEKTDKDRSREEELIKRLVLVVHRRAEIVDCLEMDRRRQEEEDESIQQHLDVFNIRAAISIADIRDPYGSSSKTKSKSLKMIQSPIKFIKKSKKNKADQIDVEKETNESEVANASTSENASTSSPHLKKNKDKSKTKSWFTK